MITHKEDGKEYTLKRVKVEHVQAGHLYIDAAKKKDLNIRLIWRATKIDKTHIHYEVIGHNKRPNKFPNNPKEQEDWKFWECIPIERYHCSECKTEFYNELDYLCKKCRIKNGIT